LLGAAQELKCLAKGGGGEGCDDALLGVDVLTNQNPKPCTSTSDLVEPPFWWFFSSSLSATRARARARGDDMWTRMDAVVVVVVEEEEEEETQEKQRQTSLPVI
jgi:hypothetical protein